MSDVSKFINQNEKNSELFHNIEEKIASQLGCSVEEVEQQYDKKMITANTNKDGQQLFMLRKLTLQEIVKGTYNNNAKYMIYTPEADYAGYIDVMVSNRKEANEAEIQYEANEKFRNKGNITIALEEVLKDVFVDKSFDGLQIKPAFPKTQIKKAVLAISDDNYASQAVAKKSGFSKNGACYEITENEFVKRLLDKKQQDYTITPNQIGKKTIYTNIEMIDKLEQIVDKKIEERTHSAKVYEHNYNERQEDMNDGR